ncbi:MAG: FMN-binding protein [Treponema sp.]|jgi:major membrane immunogen (membrane-anchored lipoprotein)|nr:FMN-binding protein [Treponema sp.]
MKNRLCTPLLITLILGAFCLSACAKETYRDGTYTGTSSLDDTGAYGEVSLTLAQGKIRQCRFVTWQKNGTIKDEDYGKVNGEISNQDFYDKAQLAVRAMERYAAQYVEVQDLKQLDAISGATIAYNQFIEAVEQALEKAR